MDGLEFDTAKGLIRELKSSGCYGEPASTLEVRIDDGQSPGGSETLDPSHWLLHEVQGYTRDHERQADHHEEWSASNRRYLSGVQHQDVQNRREQVGLRE
jgi:hypothetical protein